MTPELFYLTLTAALAASMWIPFIVGVNMVTTDPSPHFIRPPDLKDLPPWVHRAHRAHLNLIEQAVPFAILVVIAHLAGVSTTVTVFAAAAFFVIRLIHAAGMVSGLLKFPLRPIVFTAGWVANLVMVWQILAHG
ncbi:MAG: MAPEG family protein [Pseudomonadota bacterium]